MTPPPVSCSLRICPALLKEADGTLRRELQLPLGRGVLTQLAESRELVVDLAGQVDSLGGQVMKLFGRSDQASAVPVPQH